MSETTWTTRDGRTIPIRDMSDSHLRNTLAFLRRNVEHYRNVEAMRAWAYAEYAPDGAADAAEQAAYDVLDVMEDDEVLSMCVPEYTALVKEAQRRGLEEVGGDERND